METRFLKEALFSGMSANAFKLGTVLTLGWFWPRVNSCSVLYRTTNMEQMDFAHILVIANINVTTISPPSYLPHDNNATYFYIVRLVNGCGYEEQTIAAAVKVSMDADGNLAEPQPNKIFTSRAEQVDSNKIRLLWYYCPIGQKSRPSRFLTYCDGGTGQINYENPIAVIDYDRQRFYSYVTDALDAGRYLFAIRAKDNNGIENDSLAHLKIQLNTTNPDAIDILSVDAV